MFTFDEMILFEKSAKSQVSKTHVSESSIDASSSSTQAMSSLAGSGVSSVDKRIASNKSKVPPTIPKISSNSFKSKVSSAGTVRSSKSKLSKFVPPRRVANDESDQERKNILKELIALKPKKNKPKLFANHKGDTPVGKNPIKPIIRKPEQVVDIEKSNDAKLAETQAVEPDQVMSKTFVCETTVTASETNQVVATKSKPVEVLSVQSEMIEYEGVDSSETEANTQANKSAAKPVVLGSEMNPNNETKVYKCDQCQETFSYLKRYNDHESKGHCNMGITCTQCGVAFRNAKNLKRHIHRLHEKPLYKCGDCGKIFPSQKTVNKHFISHHVPHMCDWCRKVFKNANTLRSHTYNCLVKKTTKVPPTSEIDRSDSTVVIDASYKSAGTDEAHKDSETPHPEPEETETNSDQIKKQIPKPKAKLFNKECSQCNKKYQSRGGYNKHIKTHRMAEGSKDDQEMIIVDANIMKAIEDMGAANFIVQGNDVNEDGLNSQNVLLLVESND